jgi:hypothetical protein
MPVDIRVEGAFTISALGFKLPRIGLKQTSAITNYQINVQLPDSIVRRSRLTMDSSATKYDSTFWASTAILPLNMEERKAYATLDSTQKLEVQFRPTGLTAALGGEAGTVAGSFLKFLDLSFNRVEGVRVGARYEAENLHPLISLRSGLSFGFSDRVSKYLFGATVFPSAARVVGFGANVYRRIESRPDGGYYGPLFNMVTALFDKNDYNDYFWSKGWSLFIQGTASKKLRAKLSFVSEDHRSAPQRTQFSFIYPSRSYRENPTIDDGTCRAIRADVSLGDEPVMLDLVSKDLLELSVERSSPSIAASGFDYTRYSATGTLIFPTFGQDFLFRPYFKVRITAGGSTGVLPSQRWFSIDARSSALGPFGVLRTVGVKEYYGTGLIAITAEHNFRSLPFLALGLPFLYEPGLELLVHGGAARTWSAAGQVVNVPDGWVEEIGVGLGRIMDLFRIDASWRLTGSKIFCVTAGISSIL